MFLGVTLGAFGAHGLEDLLQKNDRLDTWQTAVFYQLIHAMAVWVLALVAPERNKVGFCFAMGVVVFFRQSVRLVADEYSLVRSDHAAWRFVVFGRLGSIVDSRT